MPVRNGERYEVQTLTLDLIAFVLQIKFLLLLPLQKRDNSAYAIALPFGNVIAEPIAAPGTWGYCDPSRPLVIEPVKLCRHLFLILYDHVSGKIVYVYTPLAKDVNAVVSFQYSSIWPGFQAMIAGSKG